MARLARRCRHGLAVATLVATLAGAPVTVGAEHLHDTSPQITMIVETPGNLAVRYGVDAIEQVVRSVDSGRSWSPVFSPGDAQAPDPSSPGACLPGNYERVTFLGINPLQPHGLYVGTEGMLGDYLDNGCGNAPGGLYFSLNGLGGFFPRNHGLPANADARGGGVAWGVTAITFDPRQSGIAYVQTDPSFLAVPGNARPANPTAPGIYRSVDGGSQWDPAFAGIATTPCQFGPCRYTGSLAVRPDQPSVLLYVADTGFYRSTDRGDHWRPQATLASSGHTHFLVRIDPYRADLVYVVTERAIYRSTDGGIHVSKLTQTAAPPAEVVDISFLDRTPPGVVYLLADGRQISTQDNVPGASPAATISPPDTVTQIPPSTAGKSSPTPAPHAASPTATTAAPGAVPTFTPTAMPAAVPASWPMVGHDPGQSFADPAGGGTIASVSALRVRWQRAGAYPAIEADGRLWAIGVDGKVVALNAVTGRVLHRYLSTNVRSLAYDSHLLYFNRGTEIRIVDAATADWRHSATDSQGKLVADFAQVVVANGLLYTTVGAQSSGAIPRHYAFDARTGKLIWARQATLGSTPCVLDGTLYLSFGTNGGGDSYWLDARTGAVRNVLKGFGTAQWHGSGHRVYASVLQGTGGSFRASIQAFGLDGKARWVAHDVLFGAALPDRLFAVTPGAVEARSALDGHRLWKTHVPGLQAVALGSVAVAGNRVLVQSLDGRISVLDAGSGRLLRVLQPPTPGANAGNLMVGDGLIYESVSGKAAGGTLGLPILLAFGA